MGFFKRAKESMAQAQPATERAGPMPGQLGEFGVEASATVEVITAVGEPDASGGMHHRIDVSVYPEPNSPLGESFYTTIDQRLLPEQAAGLSVGQSVTVKCDPEDPTEAILHTW